MADDAASAGLRNRVGHAVLAAAFGFLVLAVAIALWLDRAPRIDPDDARQVARGKSVYGQYCVACHGARLEGQSNWRERLPNGRMPAPPHDASGHTWHHPDDVLIGITRDGLVPGKYAPRGYESDMPAFGSVLDESDIRAVLAYIKSWWPEEVRRAQREVTLRAARK